MKSVFLTCAAVAAVAFSAMPAAAVTPITLTDGAGTFGAVVASNGMFTHEYSFTTGSLGNASGSVTTTINGLRDIDFTSILLDSFEFTQTLFDPQQETWKVTIPGLTAGPHTLTIKGNAFNVGPGRGVAYGGELSIAAIPEPATWAMMIAGFGLVGASVRRSRKVKAVLA